MIKMSTGKALAEQKKRLAYLQKNSAKIAYGFMQESAVKLIKTFHDGIKNNRFDLTELEQVTIDSKTRQKFPRPETPLYGKGDKERRASYMNMMRYKRVRGGFEVYPSRQLHWKAKIPLFDLFKIHEFGAQIKTASGVTRIPKRPAWRIAQDRFFEKYNPKKSMKLVVDRYIRKGDNKAKVDSYIKNGKLEDKK